MAGQRKEGTRRTEFHPDAEDREWLDAQADAAGMTRNEYLRRMLSDYRNGQVGEVTGGPGTSPELAEQMDRMEKNMLVLRDGIVSLAERQEFAMAAQAATMEAVRVFGEQVGQMMLPALAEPVEPPALPAPESGEDLLPRSDVREREIARYFDAGHEHLQRLMAQGDRQAAQRLLGRMRQRYGDERTARELRRRQRR